ncbi:MAG: EH signature domain-containing protein [Nitrospira sp.]|nr:EH signature domain-containing protein [Nitrospira sp.]MCP9475402.1 EH signature domain-containing protein [Nitrospira sp.]
MSETINLVDAFAALQQLDKQVKRSAHQPLNWGPSFPSKLSRLVKSWGKIPPFKGPIAPVDEVILQKWQRYRESNDTPELSSHEIGRLCQHPASATDPLFYRYLVSKHYSPPPYALLGLVYTYHARWCSLTAGNRRFIEEALEAFLRTYRGFFKALRRWQECLDYIIGSEAPVRLGRKLAEERSTPDLFAADYALHTNTEFWAEVLAQAAEYIVHRIERVPISQLEYLTRTLFDDSRIPKSRVKELLAKAILSGRCDADETARSLIISFALGSREFGDPRVHQAGWVGLEAARERFISWLSREDIKLFFDLVIDRSSDRQGRKTYWLTWLPQLKRTRVLLSRYDQARVRSRLRSRNEQIPSYGLIESPDTSAFLLDFGSVVIVEFSKSSNASYLYPRAIANDLFRDFYQQNRRWTVQELKRRDLVEQQAARRLEHRRYRHNQWQDEMTSLLSRHYRLSRPE